MASELATPTDIVWTSNGEVEVIERWCIERAHALELQDGAAGRELVGFLTSKVETSAPGMYGFSAVEKPFDDVECRRLLARLIGELAQETCASAQQPTPRWTFLHDVERTGGEPWLFASWLANLERFHVGIARSFESNPPPALVFTVDDNLRAAIDLCRWAPIWRDWRWVREQRAPWYQPYDAHKELDALDRLISAARRLLAARWTPAHAPHRLSSLGVMLANRAELLEQLDRIGEAAKTWREAAAVEADAATAAAALEIADRLDRRR